MAFGLGFGEWDRIFKDRNGRDYRQRLRYSRKIQWNTRCRNWPNWFVGKVYVIVKNKYGNFAASSIWNAEKFGFYFYSLRK